MKMNCSDCRFWSELVARAEGTSIQALCLCEDSPHYTKYTLDKHGCDLGLPALWGSIDAPGNENAYNPYPQKNVE